MIQILSKDVNNDTPNTHFDLYYEVTARTKTSVTFKFTMKSKLTSGTQLGQGSTFGIDGYIKILGVNKYIKIKGTTSADKWAANTTYTATATHTISGIKGIDTKITGVTYSQTRTGDKDDGYYTFAAEFGNEPCDDLVFPSYPVIVLTKVIDQYKSGTLYYRKNKEWTNNGLALFVKKDGVWKEV